VCIQTKHQVTSQTFPLHLVVLGKIVQIYTHVLIISNTIVYAKGQPVCIQTKYQDTSQTFPLHLVIFRKNNKNIYPCTTNIKYDSLCKWSDCVHSDETSGHKPDFPITFSYFLGNIVQIYTHVIIILNTIVCAKGQPVCIQTNHQDTSQTFPLHLVVFRKNGTNIYPCTNNIKHDSLCKGSACVHSDETSGHEPDFPITFS
jgi:hypothetical protein